jgi:hypothetical protein
MNLNIFNPVEKIPWVDPLVYSILDNASNRRFFEKRTVARYFNKHGRPHLVAVATKNAEFLSFDQQIWNESKPYWRVAKCD